MGAGSSRQSDDDRPHRDSSTHRKHLRKYRNVRPTSTKSRTSLESKSKSSESSKKYDRHSNISNKRSKKPSVKRVASKRVGRRSDSGRGSGSCTGSVSGSISERDDKKIRHSDFPKEPISNKNRRSLSESESSHVCNGPTSCSSDNDSIDSCPICSKGSSSNSSQKSKKSARHTSTSSDKSKTRRVHVQVHRGCSVDSGKPKKVPELDPDAQKRSRIEAEKENTDAKRSPRRPVRLSPSLPIVQSSEFEDRPPMKDSNRTTSEVKPEAKKSAERRR